MDRIYDHRNCQSLFGYATQVHARSGGICQLCGAGRGEPIDFDFWRQLTVEHLIGEHQGGYPKAIRAAVAERFPDLTPQEHKDLVRRIDALNTVTACSFCNATTSRDRYSSRLDTIMMQTEGEPADVVAAVQRITEAVLAKKRADVAWKLESVRHAFEAQIQPALAQQRDEA